MEFAEIGGDCGATVELEAEVSDVPLPCEFEGAGDGDWHAE